MANRINELKQYLPRSKESLDNLINMIASHRDEIDDDMLNRTLISLKDNIEEEVRDEY